MKRFLLLCIFTCKALFAFDLTCLWEADGLKMPESTLSSNKWIYVSNVNFEKQGFISRLTKEGKVESLEWIKGLNNPAGLGFLKILFI